ncbi:MAG: cyclase family protein [Polyangia bacterium]
MTVNTNTQSTYGKDDMGTTRLVDLSVAVDPFVWEPDDVRCSYTDHQRGADRLGLALAYAAGKSWLRLLRARIEQHLGRGIDHRDFPDQKGLSLMRYQLTTHTGTHMDAPFHYGPCDTSGNAARTVCQVPLEWCFRDGVVLDLSANCEDPSPIDDTEIKEALDRIHYRLKPLDIVLLRTGGDKFLGSAAYFSRFRGVTRDATRFLVEQDIKVIGIDSFGFDAPFVRMLREYQRSRDPACLWPAHLYGREREYCQLERLTNLGRIERPYGFKVACFPVKLARADAAWCRVVAMLPPNGP